MNKILLWMGILAAVCLGFGSETGLAGKAALEIKIPVFDAGSVMEGKILSHTFVLENRGDIPLLILEAKPDCGCTRTVFDKTIAPGKTGNLEVTFETLDEIGIQEKSVLLHTSDPGRPEVKVAIRAKVVEMVQIKPDRIYFSGLTGSRTEKRIVISSADKAPLGLKLKKEILPPGVKVRFEGEKDRFEVVFTNSAEKTGLYRGRVVFATDRFQRPVITIPVFSRVYGPVEAVPSRLDFGKIPIKKFNTPDRLPDRVVFLKSHIQGPFKITGMGIDGHGFRADSPEVMAAGGYRIRVFLLGGNNEKGRLAAELILETDIPGFEKMAVPLAAEKI